MHTMIKQKTDPRVKVYLDLWESLSDDGKFALDMAVYDMLVMDIDLHRKEILEEAERLHKAHVKKVYRAAAKTVLAKHRKGEHDQKDHGNWAKQTASFISESLGRDKGPEQLALFGPDTSVKPKDGQWKIISSLATLPERLNTAGENIAEGMREFLRGSSWGERILSGAEYLSRGTSVVAEAAKALVVYGPVAGARMIAAYFRYGGYDVPLGKPGTAGAPLKRGKDESLEAYKQRQHNWAVNRLKDQLPDRETMELSAGKAPSEGYIISKSGEVIAHAVGRGNDHYLPFGLKHLRKLRKDEGGVMVRRRALGGITVEDIHAAMLLGADQVTVVSRSGQFTMDLTDRAKGLHQEHTQILSRFQDLLRRESTKHNNGGAWNFSTYDNAMKALALEFPLHFNTRANAQGPTEFRDMGDMNHPKKSIIQEFRDMFGEDSDDRRGSSDSGEVASWVEAARAAGRPPKKGMTREEYEESLQGLPQTRSRYFGHLNPKTEPDDTSQKARRISPSKPVGYTTPPQEDHRKWQSFDSVIGNTPRRDNPVTVTQTRDQTPAQRQKAIEELERRRAEVRRELDEEIAEYSSAEDQADAWARQHGYNLDDDSDERGRVLDHIDYAEDDANPYLD